MVVEEDRLFCTDILYSELLTAVQAVLVLCTEELGVLKGELATPNEVLMDLRGVMTGVLQSILVIVNHQTHHTDQIFIISS